MFQLDRAIEAWLTEAVPAGCQSREHAAELEDHLRAEVDRLRDDGHGDEAAFRSATASLGSAEALALEFHRGRGRVARLFALDSPREDVTMNDRRLQVRIAALVLVQSLVWAAVMTAAATALAGTGLYEQIQHWLLAGWFATTMMPLALIDLRGSAKAEWQCLRRKLRVSRSGPSG